MSTAIEGLGQISLTPLYGRGILSIMYCFPCNMVEFARSLLFQNMYTNEFSALLSGYNKCDSFSLSKFIFFSSRLSHNHFYMTFLLYNSHNCLMTPVSIIDVPPIKLKIKKVVLVLLFGRASVILFGDNSDRMFCHYTIFKIVLTFFFFFQKY